MSDSRELSGREAILARELGEARAQIAVLREALAEYLDWHEANFVLPSGNFEDPDQMNLARAARKALAATSSDCYAQIRAEVLEEAAQSIERKMQSAHHDFTSWQARNLIRALKDKP